MNNYFWALYILAVLMASCSQILLKKSANKKYTIRLYEWINPHIIVAYGLLILSVLLSNIALKCIMYKYSAIIESLSYFCVLIFSRVFLGEEITKRKLGGMLTIIIGIVIFTS